VSSLSNLKNPNKLVAERSSILESFVDIKSLLILVLLYKRGEHSLEQIIEELVSIPESEVRRLVNRLEEQKLICREGHSFRLCPSAKARLDYDSFSLDFLIGKTVGGSHEVETPNPLRSEFAIRECIGRGATSFTFRAEQLGTHRDRTLKIFFPNAVTYEKLDSAITKRSGIKADALPDLVDVGQIRLTLPSDRSVVLPAVALTHVDSNAQTFAEFLQSQDNVAPAVLERFVEQVGGALRAIEKAGLVHGDLHEGNILVVPGDSPGIAETFCVIDFIGVPSAASPEIDVKSDMENFRDHLLRAAVMICNRFPGVSARFLLGERVFRILERVRRGLCGNFDSLLHDFDKVQAGIPDNYFKSPVKPFEFIRAEQFPSAVQLYKLFEPAPSRFEIISRFGNTWISGPRGCGKSHYLRVLAFHPDVIAYAHQDTELAEKLKLLDYDFRRSFGVLFACRLGEFKGFVPEAVGASAFDSATQAFLKHVLVLKIWNKTMDTIRRGFEPCQDAGLPVISQPSSFQRLVRFLEDRLGSIAVVDDQQSAKVLLQCIAVCAACENSAVAVWHEPLARPSGKLLDEADLDAFFALLKEIIADLRNTRFFILVDDASEGQIHPEMQKVLNSLVRAVQQNHCFKITFDKMMYTSDTSDGRPIDPRHEVTYVDLGEIVARAQRSDEQVPTDLVEYAARVVDSRLRAAGYTATIKEILGESQLAREFLAALSQPRARRPKKGEKHAKRPPRTKAYYAGWNIVWSLAHGSMRTLLELIEYIFEVTGAAKDTANIPLKAQDDAVRSYANRQFRALSMLPCELDGEPLGQRLQAVVSAIGEMSRMYLEHYDTGESGRWYETISVERLDRRKLSADSKAILDWLVKYGLLLSEGITFSRAQIGLSQRYDMNKIFAPAFQTTYRVRNHIYVGYSRFETLLTKPDVFLQRHRDKLIALAQSHDVQSQLGLDEADDG